MMGSSLTTLHRLGLFFLIDFFTALLNSAYIYINNISTGHSSIGEESASVLKAGDNR